MGLVDRLRPTGRHGPASDTIESSSQGMDTASPIDTANIDAEKRGDVNLEERQNDWVKVPEEAVPAENAQEGVKKIEAVTLTWNKMSLVFLLVKYVLSLQKYLTYAALT